MSKTVYVLRKSRKCPMKLLIMWFPTSIENNWISSKIWVEIGSKETAWKVSWLYFTMIFFPCCLMTCSKTSVHFVQKLQIWVVTSWVIFCTMVYFHKFLCDSFLSIWPQKSYMIIIWKISRNCWKLSLQCIDKTVHHVHTGYFNWKKT